MVAILQGALAALTAGSLVLFAVLAATIGLQTPTGDVSSPAGRDRIRGGAITLEGGTQNGGGESGNREETPSGATVAAAPSAPPPAGGSTAGTPEPRQRDTGADSLNLSLGIEITPPGSPDTRTIAGTAPLGSLGRVLNQLGIRVLFPSVGAGQSRFAVGRLHLGEEHRAILKLLRKRARDHRKANQGDGGESSGSAGQGRSDNEHADSHGSKSGNGSHSKKSGKSSHSDTIGKHAGGGQGNKGGKHDKGGSKKEKSKGPDDESVSSGGGSKKEKSKKDSDDDDDGRHGHDDDDDDDHHHHDDDDDDDDHDDDGD